MTTEATVHQLTPKQRSGPARVWPKREFDDIGNAERLVDHFGREIRYLIDAEQWATYEDGRWVLKGGAAKVWTRCIRTISVLPNTEAAEYSPKKTGSSKDATSPREDFEKWVRSSRSRAKLAAMRDVATGLEDLHCQITDFDQDPMLLNVRNGVLDMRNRRLLPHEPDLYLMQQSPVRFDAKAECPTWTAFLNSVMPDLDRQRYLARVVGYTLTGSTQEQAMFIHHGEGQNGKGVFMRVLMGLLGDYAQAVPRTTLLAKGTEGIPNDVARMLGKRLLSTTETSAGKRLDDELVKQLTGEDVVSARFLHGEYFDFRPVGKIHLATNYLPRVGGGHGIARRLHDIGWDVTVPPEARIPNLDEKIMQEASGVLNWALRGFEDWMDNGLSMPEAVKAKTQEHIAKSDPIAMWIEECTEKAQDPNHIEEVKLLFTSYKVWCQAGSLREMSVMAFSQAMEERGYEKTRHPVNRRMSFRGVRLVPTQF